jgi:dinuclear metal center YbgI/SA1388 family protein
VFRRLAEHFFFVSKNASGVLLMKLQELAKKLNNNLPIELVAEQDNVGLIIGNYDDECEKMTLAYELNKTVLDEALANHSNLVVTYHTPLFHAKKSFTSSASRPDPLFDAARARMNVFAVHTAIDVVKDGLNFDLAVRMGLKNIKVLSPIKNSLYKVVVFVPSSHLDKVREAMADAGAGNIGNYSDCSFVVEGKGSFLPSNSASPYVGEAGKFERVDETRLEMIVAKSLIGSVINEMLKAHPYEEAAYDIYPLVNDHADLGFGAVGELEEPVLLNDFISHVKETLGLDSMKLSRSPEVKIRRVALCAGAGVPFYDDAIRDGADIFITGDVKHHDFREAQPCRTILADATHVGSEKFAIEVMSKVLRRILSDTISIEMSKSKTINAITI